jgi:hypothetical protein
MICPKRKDKFDERCMTRESNLINDELNPSYGRKKDAA